MAGTPSSAASRALLEGADCRSVDKQQRSYGPVSHKTNNKRGPELREDWKTPNAKIQNKRSHADGAEGVSYEHRRSFAGVDVGFPDDLEEPLYPTPLIPHLTISSENNQEDFEDHSKIDAEFVDVFKHTATQSGSCHATTSTVTKTGLGLTSHSLQSSQYQRKTSDTKVFDWLTHGLSDSSPTEAVSLMRNSRDSDRSFAPRYVPLSLFPPKSPLGDVREYMPRNSLSINSVYPASPLNNGRDAYGNHIPSNTRDYLTAHSQPSLPNPLATKDEKTFSSEKPSTTRRLYDCRWDRLKSYWKATGTQAPNPQMDPRYPHIILDTDNIPRDVPEVVYSGRVGDRGLHNISLPFSAAYSRLDSRANNMKGNYSTPDLRENMTQDAKSNLGKPELVDASETLRSKNHFTVTCNHENTSRDEGIWQKGSFLLPRRSLQIERNEDHTSAYLTEGRTANMMSNGSSRAYLRVDRERQMRPIEKKKPSHGDVDCGTEEQLTCQQVLRKQDQSLVGGDAHIAAITPLLAKKPIKLEHMLDFGIQLPRESTSSSRNLFLQDPITVPAQDPKKQKKDIATPEHLTPAPASVPAMTFSTKKPQPLLRTILSKAGNISRSIFTASFDPKSKASSQHQPSTDSSKTSLPKVSMSADHNGWPRANPPNTHGEANTLAGHYEVLTAGAFVEPLPSHHNRHESLASVTNEALLIADQLLQRDVRCSTDQVRSSFSFDSVSEIATQQRQKERGKIETRKKGEIAKAMAWMGLYL
ncbi:hypothetical protein yc1106_03845 [Curvularia clavata]|uniref:Uncharacterized protein n=1 Tax=Curvularia clavata TaxID=95742 RepID=A0A9Q8Z593_CURCL|nr:hypothetical protein yc1106_03845 [Curvularia clavata]